MRLGAVGVWVIVGGVVVALARVSDANGYRVLGVRSARATALGEAVVAWPDEPAAVVFNPAGLADLDGSKVNAHVTFCRGYIRHTGVDGVETRNEDSWQAVPSAFVTSDMGTDWLGIGFGVSLPNGLSSEWGDDSFARYVATYSELSVADIGPAIGCRLGSRFFAGAGLSYYRSSAKLDAMVDGGLMALASGVPGAVPGAADLKRRIEGDGDGWGGRVGAIFMPAERHRVGMAYHMPFSVSYDGTMEVQGAMPRTDVTTDIDFPAVLSVGYAVEASSRLRVEADLDWTLWNAVDDIAIRVKAPGAPVAGTMKQGLENALTWKFGVQYACTDSLALRAGYIYNQNATPEANWRPSLPDTDTHFFMLGGGYSVGCLTFDLALQAVHYEKRAINNNVDDNESISSSSVDGTYRNWAPSVSLGVTCSY